MKLGIQKWQEGYAATSGVTWYLSPRIFGIMLIFLWLVQIRMAVYRSCWSKSYLDVSYFGRGEVPESGYGVIGWTWVRLFRIGKRDL